ncbi:MAG: hypothetical protein H3C47_14250 [Candidatus Cloacimonetes bacterium]|nr:hypothetical protein [Candidatus Cloacimonadota bacterium]
MIAALWIPCIRLQAVLPKDIRQALLDAQNRSFSLPDFSMGLCTDLESGQILEVCQKAEAEGVRAGMSVLRAKIQSPDLQLFIQDSLVYQKVLDEVKVFLNACSPRWQEVEAGLFLLELDWLHSGISKEEAKKTGAKLLQKICHKTRLMASLSLANKPLPARLAALESKAFCVTVISQQRELQLMSRQPVDICPLSPKTLGRLKVLGISTLGDLAQITRQDLVSQFGMEGHVLHQASLGGAGIGIPIAQDKKRAVLRESMETALQPRSWIFKRLTLGIQKLCLELSEEGLGFFEIEVRFFLENQSLIKLNLVLPTLTRDLDSCERLFHLHFEKIQFEDAIAFFEIELLKLTPWQFQQSSLKNFYRPCRNATNLQNLFYRLQTRGYQLWEVISSVPGHRIPERRAFLRSLDSKKNTRSLCVPKPIQIKEDEEGKPLSLMVNHRAYWVDRVLQVWNVCEDWWTQCPVDRSYYRLQLKNGAVLKVFRDNMGSSWFRQVG